MGHEDMLLEIQLLSVMREALKSFSGLLQCSQRARPARLR